jgi:hypothetical protein
VNQREVAILGRSVLVFYGVLGQSAVQPADSLRIGFSRVQSWFFVTRFLSDDLWTVRRQVADSPPLTPESCPELIQLGVFLSF